MEDILSVVVPVFNVGNYVEECIDSIRRQIYENLEIIIVDDGSTDSSGEICERLAGQDKRVTVLHQENQGVMAARIRGIEEASGRWITFVDGDDFIKPDMYAYLLRNIGNCEMITCGVSREEQNDVRDVCDDFPEGLYVGGSFGNMLGRAVYDFEDDKMQRLTPWLFNKIYITKYMKDAASECKDMHISYAEDSVMLYRYLLKCRAVRVCKDIFYTYRYRGDSAIHSGNDAILTEINKVYLALKDSFAGTDRQLRLEEQLQKWIICMTGYAFRHQMRFREEVCPMEFLADVKMFMAERVVIYGAGKCGRDFCRQLNMYEKKPVIWVDKNYQIYKKNGDCIEAPDKLLDTDFDMVVIAVSRWEQAEEIRNILIGMGVPLSKIHWRKPVRLF